MQELIESKTFDELIGMVEDDKTHKLEGLKLLWTRYLFDLYQVWNSRDDLLTKLVSYECIIEKYVNWLVLNNHYKVALDYMRRGYDEAAILVEATKEEGSYDGLNNSTKEYFLGLETVMIIYQRSGDVH
jgi:hypothetical protein